MTHQVALEAVADTTEVSRSLIAFNGCDSLGSSDGFGSPAVQLPVVIAVQRL
jgi:hypothetical protein